MIDPNRLETDPCSMLREVLTDDDVQTVLSINSRVQPDTSVAFESGIQEAIGNPDTARIYLLSLTEVADSYRANRERFRSRHDAAQVRTTGLLKYVYPSLEAVVEAPDSLNSAPNLYTTRLTPGELGGLVAKYSSTDPTVIRDETYRYLGVPDDVRFLTTGLSWLKAYRTVEEMIAKGHAFVGYPHGLFDAHLLYSGDVVGQFHQNSGVIGIGEYEQPFAEKLLRAHTLVAHAVKLSYPIFAQYEKEAGPKEVSSFSRSIDREVDGSEDPHLVTQGTLYEASLTVVQSLSLLAAQRQPGYEDVDMLVADMIDQGIIERLARKMPHAGVIGPMAIRGLVFLDMLNLKDGTISLNHDLEVAFAAARRNIRDYALIGPDTRGLGERDYQKRFISYLGCPAAYDQVDGYNAVTQVARLFKTAYQKVS